MAASVKIAQLSDAELLELYKKKGDGRYVGELFERYSHLTFGVCMKYLKNEEEARDASMQVFEKLFEDIKKHEIANFKGWLHMVARNYCLMQLRSAKSRVHRQTKEFEERDADSVEFDYESHLNNNQGQEMQFQRLEHCINKLKDEQKICVEMFFLKEMCYKEIADKTKFDIKKVKSHIQNGKRNLKICMTSFERETSTY